MNKISQLQLKFLAVEDRLLLRINTSNKEEFIFLLTRRFVALLYPILTQVLQTDKSVNNRTVTNDTLQQQQTKKEILNFQQQQLAEKTDNSSPYQESGLSHPLSNHPILLANISTLQTPEGLKLCLTPESGKGVSFFIDQSLTHLIRNLLLESLKSANWQLPFESEHNLPSSTTLTDKKTLH